MWLHLEWYTNGPRVPISCITIDDAASLLSQKATLPQVDMVQNRVIKNEPAGRYYDKPHTFSES